MISVVVRTVLIYFIVILAMRFMGKKQLGELQPSELVSTIFISNLASIAIENPDFALTPSIAPLILIICLEIIISSYCVKSKKMSKLISGSPRVIIKNGQLNQKLLHDLRFSVDDLLCGLRAKDIFELSEVDFAIIETNGTINARKKFEQNTPTNKDFNIKKPDATIPSIAIIEHGALDEENMKLCGITLDFVKNTCQEHNCETNEVLLLLCNDIKQTYLIKKEHFK